MALSCKQRVERFSARLKIQIGPSDMKRAGSHIKQLIEFIWYSIDKVYSIVLNFVVHYVREVFHKIKKKTKVCLLSILFQTPPPLKFRPKNNRFGKGIFRFLRTGFKHKKTNKQRVSGRGRLSSVHLC